MVAHTCDASTQELRQEACCELKASLNHRMRPCLRKQTNKQTKNNRKKKVHKHMRESPCTLPVSPCEALCHPGTLPAERHGPEALYLQNTKPLFPIARLLCGIVLYIYISLLYVNMNRLTCLLT